MRVYGLRCEYFSSPLGIDVPIPRLSWVVESERRADIQTAYQIVVDAATDLPPGQVTIWDSGRVDSSESVNVEYRGSTLQAHQRCFWKVRVWDCDGRPSAWSAPGVWTMGLLCENRWPAPWIGYDRRYPAIAGSPHVEARSRHDEHMLPPSIRVAKRIAKAVLGEGSSALRYLRRVFKSLCWPLVRRHMLRRWAEFEPALVPCAYLRNEFDCTRPKRALVHATALGVYELWVNGTRVGEDHFAPGWTDYGRRVYYQTYDITDQLIEGANAIGAVLGDGWYSGYIGPNGRRCHYGLHARFSLHLHIEAADGSRRVLTTGAGWRSSTGPILASDFLAGESYDARLERPGWSQPGFNDADWHPVDVTNTVDTRVEAAPHGGIRCVAEIAPVAVRPAGDAYIFDLGRNFAGWVRLKVGGAAGRRITLRFAERLDRHGDLYVKNLRSARATDTFVKGTDNVETWEPRFTYHGFQYVEIRGLTEPPGPDTVVGIAIQSDAVTTGEFECSNPLINTLFENIRWTQRANFVDLPTDCPQRDERLGWLGDAQIFMRTATYNLDVAAFFTKWFVDVADAQSSAGAYPDYAPRLRDGPDGSPAWGDAGIICVWVHYIVYRDTRIVETHYASMRRWVEYVHDGNPNLLWRSRLSNDNGEWLELGARTPSDVFATAYFAHSVGLLGRMAAIIGRAADAAEFQRLFVGIRDAFNRAFVSSDGRIKGDTQTVYVLALRFDLLSPDQRRQAAGHLIRLLEDTHGHLSTGFFATGHIAPVLTSIGRIDMAYRLLTNETFPSWGYAIRQGATSIWERWDGWTEEKGFQDPIMNSFCHYGFGAIGEWLYSSIAGIDLIEPGFKRFAIHPQPGGGLSHARATYDSVHGRIESEWRLSATDFTLNVRIPANTIAMVTLPAPDLPSIRECGTAIDAAEGIRLLGVADGEVSLEVGSGSYAFTVAGDSKGRATLSSRIIKK